MVNSYISRQGLMCFEFSVWQMGMRPGSRSESSQCGVAIVDVNDFNPSERIVCGLLWGPVSPMHPSFVRI